jgi:cytochrome c-type biogenesis protein
MTEGLSLLLVFSAGLLSFLSPCVLPLIPSYLSILGGLGIDKEIIEKKESTRFRLFFPAAGFVLGFSFVFITLGILVSKTFFFMGGISGYINLAAGIIVIVLGFNVLFDFFKFINYEKRPFLLKWMKPGTVGKSSFGSLAAFFAGAAFGAGWTPCIGPILTGILLMAGQGGKTGTAVFYLAVYSAGLAVPFLLTALFLDFFIKRGSALRSGLPLIRRISGILLIIIGLLIIAGKYSALNILIQKATLSYIYWAEDKALPFRLLANALSWLQNF